MTRQRKTRNGMSYILKDGFLQVTANLLSDQHDANKCAWCQRYARGLEQTHCPENPQMELFQ